MTGFLDKVIAACEAYNQWFDKSRWGGTKIPNCPFCGANRRSLHMGAPRLVPYRYQNARVLIAVRCGRCDARMTASSSYGSSKWTYFVN